MEYMKVDKIKLIANEGEVLSLEYEDVYYPAIKLKRCFPFKCPTSYISVCNSENDQEIGIIYDLNELDSKMLQIAIDELNFRYFVPVITKISKIKLSTKKTMSISFILIVCNSFFIFIYNSSSLFVSVFEISLSFLSSSSLLGRTGSNLLNKLSE